MPPFADGPPPEKFWLPKPAIIRPADDELLRYGGDPALANLPPGWAPVMVAGPSSAFPDVLGTVATTETTSSGGTFTINMPSGIQAGELLVAILNRTPSGQTYTWPAGWSELVSGNVGNRRLAVAVATASGSEGGTLSVTSSDTGSRVRGALVFRVGPWTDRNISSVATGTSTTPNPPSHTSGWGVVKTLWIAICGLDGNGSNAISGYPSGFGIAQTTNTGSGTFVPVGVACQQDEVASKDPGTFSYGASRAWAAYTMAVRGT